MKLTELGVAMIETKEQATGELDSFGQAGRINPKTAVLYKKNFE